VSTLTELRAALKATLDIGLNGAGVSVYEEVPETIKVPAIVIEPANADFTIDFAGGATWLMDLVVLVQRSDSGRGQRELDKYIETTGTYSIPKIIRVNCGLGLTDSDACCQGMQQYGASFVIGGIEYVGAVIKTSVTTEGS
jgi:hypothetical protein